MTRFLIVAFAAVSVHAQPAYDLILKGGRVIDPKSNLNRVADVAIAAGKIARIDASIPASEARRVADVSGLYVTPGLIDIHAHLYNRPGYPSPKRNQSVQPDTVSFRTGITTMVDAGTSGWRDFPDFRRGTIERSQTRVLAFLNIVAAGMGMGNEHDAEQHDADAAAKMALQHRDVIVGFKTAHYEGPGWVSVDNLLKAARQANLPVMVDFGKVTADRNIRTLLLDKLRPGDIYTHCFSGLRGELVDGKVSPVMLDARKRGIIMDLGHGGGSFFWNITTPMIQQKFYPDSISTDMHFGSINGGMKDILNVASKLLILGVPFDQIVRMLTTNPANEIRRPNLGNLDIGAEADVAVLRIDQGQFGFLDSAGARQTGSQRIACEMTVRAGKVVWDLNARSAPDWKGFDYRRRPRP